MAQTPTNLEQASPADRVWQDAGVALERVLGELSPEERVFLKMRVLHGCTVSEIARAFHFEAPSFRRRFRSLLETLSRHVTTVPRERP